MLKVKLCGQFLLEIELIQELCNMIGPDRFWPQQIQIFTSILSFLQSILTSKELCWLTQLLLRYSQFINLNIWLAENFLDHAQLKFYWAPFTFLESISWWQRYSWFTNYYLRFRWCTNSAIWLAKILFHLDKLKIFKSTFIFLQLI